MKRLLIVLLLVGGLQMQAQSSDELLKHYQAYYKQNHPQHSHSTGDICSITYSTEKEIYGLGDGEIFPFHGKNFVR